MAKLHSYCILCPLLDRRSFLGISHSKEGDVIVTLGRNVVSKYRLSDQKQTGGWTSKEHITSAVVYDEDTDEYVGVFNNNIIKTWKEETENLEKLKKYKLSASILKIIKYGKTSLVVFGNGTCASLQYCLEDRKASEQKPLLKNGDSIVDIASYTIQDTDYVCFIVKTAKGSLDIITCPLEPDLGNLVTNKLQKHKVTREDADVRVIGKVITVAEQPTVYILWSDAKVYSFNLTTSKWKLCGTVPWISPKSNFSMEWMGDKHLILFGSDNEQDGAILVAFNVVLGMGSCRYPMKIYCENAKIYCFNQRLILESGNHLGMLPYALETSRSLASIIGTHEILPDENTERADWGLEEALSDDEYEGEYKELLNKGMTQQAVAQQLIPPLLSNEDHSQVLNLVKQFNDLSEDVIVQLLQYGIKLFNHDEAVLQDKSEFKKMYKNNPEKNNFLNFVFGLSFSDAVIIPYLRNGLNLKEALFLMTYLGHLLEDEDENYYGLDYERMLIDWCALLMDAFYQQYLITTDKTVSNTLEYTKSIIVKLVKSIDEISDVIPVLCALLNKHKKTDDIIETPLYSIEVMKM